jgi:hypothetical protein
MNNYILISLFSIFKLFNVLFIGTGFIIGHIYIKFSFMIQSLLISIFWQIEKISYKFFLIVGLKHPVFILTLTSHYTKLRCLHIDKSDITVVFFIVLHYLFTRRLISYKNVEIIEVICPFQQLNYITCFKSIFIDNQRVICSSKC